MASPIKSIYTTASMIISQIGLIELPLGTWSSFTTDLINGTYTDNIQQKLTALTTLCFFCQDAV